MIASLELKSDFGLNRDTQWCRISCNWIVQAWMQQPASTSVTVSPKPLISCNAGPDFQKELLTFGYFHKRRVNTGFSRQDMLLTAVFLVEKRSGSLIKKVEVTFITTACHARSSDFLCWRGSFFAPGSNPVRCSLDKRGAGVTVQAEFPIGLENCVLTIIFASPASSAGRRIARPPPGLGAAAE